MDHAAIAKQNVVPAVPSTTIHHSGADPQDRAIMAPKTTTPKTTRRCIRTEATSTHHVSLMTTSPERGSAARDRAIRSRSGMPAISSAREGLTRAKTVTTHRPHATPAIAASGALSNGVTLSWPSRM